MSAIQPSKTPDSNDPPSNFQNLRHVATNGTEFWRAREIQPALGYQTWENFHEAIKRAEKACESAGISVFKHFRETTKMKGIGRDAERATRDYFLSRRACYLIAMNADSTKPEIAAAQIYFAEQVVRIEELDRATVNAPRLELRQRYTIDYKHCCGVAQKKGVVRFDRFNDAGYRGLYTMPLAAIKAKKGIGKDSLLDRAGRAELAANAFRITQTENKLVSDKVEGEDACINTALEVGKMVRQAIAEIGGTMPEDLPAEPHIKTLMPGKKKLPPATE